MRNSPAKAGEIAEAAASGALRRLLVRVASAGHPIFTLGCDLGAHQEPTSVPARRREVAGGYIQFASAKYDRTGTQSYEAFADLIGESVKSCAVGHNWKLQCIGKWVDFKFEGEPQGLQPSLWVWFFAASSNVFNALKSRERLIEAIDKAIELPKTLEPFMSEN